MASVVRFLDEAPAPLPVFELPLRGEPGLCNRRSLPRVAAPFTVRLHEDGSVLAGLDLSFGGLMCACNEPVWPGNVVELDLQLPGAKAPMPLRGRVVELVSHRAQIAMRVRFEDADQACRKRIAAWMAEAHGL
jgi:hypothetical protein